jgi:molybdopterin synthase catalytic subunit
MRIRVLLFAALRERAGCAELELELPEGSEAAAAKAALEERFPRLVSGVRAAMAVNGEYARDGRQVLREGDEVAFLPPVSGG